MVNRRSIRPHHETIRTRTPTSRNAAGVLQTFLSRINLRADPLHRQSESRKAGTGMRPTRSTNSRNSKNIPKAITNSGV